MVGRLPLVPTLLSWVAGLRGPDRVVDQQAWGKSVQQPGLGADADSGAPPGQDDHERAQVVVPVLDLVAEGPGEGVAHDARIRDPLAVDRVEDRGGSSWVTTSGKTSVPPPGEHAEGHPLRGAVHERRQHGSARSPRCARAWSASRLEVEYVDAGRTASPPIVGVKMSSWRHSTPLGMPVVPPV